MQHTIPVRMWPHLASSSLLKEQSVVIVEQEDRESPMKQPLGAVIVKAVGVSL